MLEFLFFWVPKRQVAFHSVFRKRDSPTNTKHRVQLKLLRVRWIKSRRYFHFTHAVVLSSHFICTGKMPPRALTLRQTYFQRTNSGEGVLGHVISVLFFSFVRDGLIEIIRLFFYWDSAVEAKFQGDCPSFVVRCLVPEAHMEVPV